MLTPISVHPSSSALTKSNAALQSGSPSAPYQHCSCSQSQHHNGAPFPAPHIAPKGNDATPLIALQPCEAKPTLPATSEEHRPGDPRQQNGVLAAFPILVPNTLLWVG